MRFESVARIEPIRLAEPTAAIANLTAELAAATAVLGKSLHARTLANLADLVRIMNTYYSNLIEGHNTRPREILRALEGRFDQDEGRRNLQLEAAAHVRVQREIDRLGGEQGLPAPASEAFILWLHAEFYRDAPEAMLSIQARSGVLVDDGSSGFAPRRRLGWPRQPVPESVARIRPMVPERLPRSGCLHERPFRA